MSLPNALSGPIRRSSAGHATGGRWLRYVAGLALGIVAACASLTVFSGSDETPAGGDDDLFAPPRVPRLRLRVAAEDVARLRANPRSDVVATVREGALEWTNVALHLKGSTGSFRGVDDKPSLTLNFDKLAPSQRFHGLRKLHLNNSAEDPAYFNELVGAALFRVADVPAPQVTHAVVELNGRRLGLYVLKEGFAPEFLARHFKDAGGNLYETGPGWDVDEALSREQGQGPDDRADLRALVAAIREPDPARRWDALAGTLDRDRFVSFMATEILAGHRDGYCLARNNYRIYHDPTTNRLVFLPAGMDQLFGRADATIRPVPAGLVARAVLASPAGRAAYRERLAQLATNALDAVRCIREADSLVARLRPVLEARELAALRTALADTLPRISARRAWLETAIAQPQPSPLVFTNGWVLLTGWRTVDSPADGAMDRGPALGGLMALHIRAGPMTSASWRAKALLSPGRYRFEGQAMTRGVTALGFGKFHGAGLRVDGVPSVEREAFVGDHDWTRLTRRFTLTTETEVEAICELRAAAGEAWFAEETLKMVRED